MAANKRAFLAAITISPNICAAATAAGVDRHQHYRWMHDDPNYVIAFDEAWEQGIDVLESEAVRRARDGVDEPVFSGGRRALDVQRNEDGTVKLDPQTGKPAAIPATVRKYSDTLLMFLLNGNRSRKYRQRSDTRFVDAEGNDRKLLDLASVRAFMLAADHEGNEPAAAPPL